MNILTQSPTTPATNGILKQVPAATPAVPTELHLRPNKRTPRQEHLQAQRLRVDESPTLAAKFPRLKSLMVSLDFVGPQGVTRTSGMKYSVNPEHARSVFLFSCPNRECIGGDFDLTSKLAAAIAAGRAKVAGEMHCLGTHKGNDGKRAPCRSVLRFGLTLSYSKKR